MPNKNVYAVVLAGGSGTRFWPLSRQKNPKQFLKIPAGKTLLQQTLERVRGRVDSSNILIVGGKAFARQIREQAAPFRIPPQNILLEPSGKNTAPAICWAAARIHRRNPRAVMAVFPSDHLILNKKNFLKTLEAAVKLAGQDYLVTLGIVPSRPETGYGYLKTKKVLIKGKQALRVERFIEKPSVPKAKAFFKNRSYFWNSGMFAWKTETILNEFRRYLPGMYSAIAKSSSDHALRKAWSKFKGITVDYGILAKSRRVMAVPAQKIGWSDLGSWEALADISAKDKRGNASFGDVWALDCNGTFIFGGPKLVAAIGLKDVVIVDTPDALLVCRKNLSQQVRVCVDHLKKIKRKEL